MAIEIERKFLIVDDAWRSRIVKTERLKQGYLTSGGVVTVRVRTVDDRLGFITIKGGGSALARAEFEYEIPIADARQLLGYCSGAQIEKRRHTLNLDGGAWVVDEFAGRHVGLLLAEVELQAPPGELPLPGWVGDEVTGDPHYYNSTLAALPDSGEI